MSNETFDRDAMRIEALAPELRREVLTAYLDDELSPEAGRYVTAWLDAHPEELREVEHQRRVWDLLELYEDEPVPDGFATRVQAALGKRRSTGRTGRLLAGPTARWIALGAAALLLVALGVGLLVPRGDTPSATQRGDVAQVPVEFLEEADVVLALSDEEFQAFLLADLEEPWEDG